MRERVPSEEHFDNAAKFGEELLAFGEQHLSEVQSFGHVKPTELRFRGVEPVSRPDEAIITFFENARLLPSVDVVNHAGMHSARTRLRYGPVSRGYTYELYHGANSGERRIEARPATKDDYTSMLTRLSLMEVVTLPPDLNRDQQRRRVVDLLRRLRRQDSTGRR